MTSTCRSALLSQSQPQWTHRWRDQKPLRATLSRLSNLHLRQLWLQRRGRAKCRMLEGSEISLCHHACSRPAGKDLPTDCVDTLDESNSLPTSSPYPPFHRHHSRSSLQDLA